MSKTLIKNEEEWDKWAKEEYGGYQCDCIPTHFPCLILDSGTDTEYVYLSDFE